MQKANAEVPLPQVIAYTDYTHHLFTAVPHTHRF